MTERTERMTWEEEVERKLQGFLSEGGEKELWSMDNGHAQDLSPHPDTRSFEVELSPPPAGMLALPVGPGRGICPTHVRRVR